MYTKTPTWQTFQIPK